MGISRRVTELRERPSGGRVRHVSALEVQLGLPAGPPFTAVARLVVAGMAARSGLGVDRMEELQLAVEAAVRRAQASQDVSIRMRPGADRFRLRIGPLAITGAELDDLEHVLSGLVDEVATHETDGDVWIDVEVALRSLATARR